MLDNKQIINQELFQTEELEEHTTDLDNGYNFVCKLDMLITPSKNYFKLTNCDYENTYFENMDLAIKEFERLKKLERIQKED